MPGGVRNSFIPAHERMASRGSRSQSHFTQAPMSEMEGQEELPLPSRKRMLTDDGQSVAGQPMHEGEYYGEEEMYNGSGPGPRGFGRNWNLAGRSAEIVKLDWGNGA